MANTETMGYVEYKHCCFKVLPQGTSWTKRTGVAVMPGLQSLLGRTVWIRGAEQVRGLFSETDSPQLPSEHLSTVQPRYCCSLRTSWPQSRTDWTVVWLSEHGTIQNSDQACSERLEKSMLGVTESAPDLSWNDLLISVRTDCSRSWDRLLLLLQRC